MTELRQPTDNMIEAAVQADSAAVTRYTVMPGPAGNQRRVQRLTVTDALTAALAAEPVVPLRTHQQALEQAREALTDIAALTDRHMRMASTERIKGIRETALHAIRQPDPPERV